MPGTKVGLAPGNIVSRRLRRVKGGQLLIRCPPEEALRVSSRKLIAEELA